jgi:hypothetical protein
MAREVFFARNHDVLGGIEAAINFDAAQFGVARDVVSPWTVSISNGAKDLGRIVGFEGEGQTIISMHQLKPDIAATRGCEMTVFRMSNDLVMAQLDAPVLGAFERWLLRRGWRGNIVKKLKFSDEKLVVAIRTFWVRNGYELVLAQESTPDKPGWDEHVVKRWR